MNDDNDRPSTDSSAETATGAAPAEMPAMAELEADIARTRDELADTVDQLAAKLDVKARVRSRVSETKDAATTQLQTVRTHLVGVDGKPRPVALTVGGGVVAAIAAVVLVRLWTSPSNRRRSRRRR